MEVGNGEEDGPELESLDDAKLYTCVVCMDIFYEPVTLLCGHSYCFTCLYRMERANRKSECPVCREKWTIWPRTNCVLSEIIKQQFPHRWKRGEREKREEAVARRRELEEQINHNKTHWFSIITRELMIIGVILVVLFLLFWKPKRIDYY